MALIGLHINDPANRLTLKAMLELEGHRILEGDVGTPLLITDDLDRAPDRVSETTTVLVLCTSDEVGRAVDAMKKGVYGYIFLPFQPGEAGLMVQRALGAATSESSPARSPESPLRRLEDVESDYILGVLRRCKNNQARAARVLGIGRNTLWRKLRKIETIRKMAGQDPLE
jgi:DNA-binding NtrC family response regulator